MRRHLLLLALLAFALVGVALLAVPGLAVPARPAQGARPPGRPRGRARGAAEARPPARRAQDLDRSIAVMREPHRQARRLRAGAPQAGPNQIVIQLPAVHDADEAAAIIGQTAQLELYDLESSLAPPSIDAAENPVAFAQPLRPAHPRAVGPARQAERSTGSSAADEDARRRPRRLESSSETAARRAEAPKPCRRLASKSSRDDSETRRLPVLTTPAARRDHVLGRAPRPSAPACPASRRRSSPYYYLFEHDRREMTGDDC